MQARIYINEPSGASPDFTATLFFTGVSPAGLAAGDLVVDTLEHIYTVTGVGTMDGAKRTGVTLRDNGLGAGTAPAVGYGMSYTPTAHKGLSQPPLVDVSALQSVLHKLQALDMQTLDAPQAVPFATTEECRQGTVTDKCVSPATMVATIRVITNDPFWGEM